MKSNVLLAFVMFIVLVASGCTEKNGKSSNKAPPTRSAGTVTGIGFHGLINGGDVKIFSFDKGGKGELLATGVTDENGAYSITVTSPSTFVLIEISGGVYKEESSGREITILDSEKLMALVKYESGQAINASVTYFTHLATGLAEFLISSGFPADKAIVESNKRIGDLIGVDIIGVKPIDVTNARSASAYVSPEHAYGLAVAAISSYMAYISSQNDSPVHDIFNSKYFSHKSYGDIKNDGKLDGMDADGKVSLGTVQVTADTYRYDIATNIFAFAASATNKTALGAKAVRELALKLNNSGDAAFSNEPVKDFALLKPTVVNVSLKNGDVLSLTKSISFDVVDILGVNSVSVKIDDPALPALKVFMPGDLFSLDLDTTKLSDGAHNIIIVASNSFGGVTTESVAVSIANRQTAIFDVFPPHNSYVRGNISFSAKVSDPLGVLKTVVEIDGNPVINALNPLTPKLDIITADFRDGPHIVKVSATSTIGNVLEVDTTYTVDNTPPIATLSITDGLLLDDAGNNVNLTVDDAIKFKSGTLFFNGVLLQEFTKPTPDIIIPFISKDIAEGKYPFVLKAFDEAGNKAELTKNVYIDRVSPAITFISPPDNEDYALDNIPVNATATDVNAIKLLQFALDGVIMGTLANSVDKGATIQNSLFSEGTHKIEIFAEDNSGRSTNVARMITVNRTPPTPSVVSYKCEEYSSAPTRVKITAVVAVNKPLIKINASGTNNTRNADGSICSNCNISNVTVSNTSVMYDEPLFGNCHATGCSKWTKGMINISATNKAGTSSISKNVTYSFNYTPNGGRTSTTCTVN